MEKVLKSVRTEGAVTIAVPSGEVDLQRSPDMHRELQQVCARKPQKLVVDLREVTYMDSSGVSTLVEVFRSMHAYGGALVLLAPTDRVRSMLEIAKLDQFFTILESEQEALDS